MDDLNIFQESDKCGRGELIGNGIDVQFRGSPSISIREYAKLDDGKVVPTKKGIFLTEENYRAMMECEGVVKQLIEKVKKGETV